MTRIRERLIALQREHERGRQQLGALDRQRREVAETVLRIEGAIQVLEELLADADPAPLEVASEA